MRSFKKRLYEIVTKILALSLLGGIWFGWAIPNITFDVGLWSAGMIQGTMVISFILACIAYVCLY